MPIPTVDALRPPWCESCGEPFAGPGDRCPDCELEVSEVFLKLGKPSYESPGMALFGLVALTSLAAVTAFYSWVGVVVGVLSFLAALRTSSAVTFRGLAIDVTPSNALALAFLGSFGVIALVAAAGLALVALPFYASFALMGFGAPISALFGTVVFSSCCWAPIAASITWVSLLAKTWPTFERRVIRRRPSRSRSLPN
jgi:hypothetical protein